MSPRLSDLTNETAVSGIRLLIRLVNRGHDRPVTPRELAGELALSPSYLAKVAQQLVRAGICHAHRGAKGGITLAREARSVTVLDILEACQGKILGGYCTETSYVRDACKFHQCMQDLQRSMTGALGRWTLADLAVRPKPVGNLRGHAACRMSPGKEARTHAR